MGQAAQPGATGAGGQRSIGSLPAHLPTYQAGAPHTHGAPTRSAKESPGERERAEALSHFNRTRRRVRRVRGNFFAGELAPRRRNCFLAVSAPGNAKHFSGNCVGVEVCRGSLLPRHLIIALSLSCPRSPSVPRADPDRHGRSGRSWRSGRIWACAGPAARLSPPGAGRTRG